MTHCCALVVVPADGDLHEHLNSALDPWREEYQDEAGEWQYREDGWWDWWAIGGRFTGRHNDYDPCRDPANWEPCWLCNATGVRPESGLLDGKPWCNGCTHCREYGCPVGWSLKWSTDWVPHDGNVAPPAAFLSLPADEKMCWTIVAGEIVAHREVFKYDDATEQGEFIVTPDFDGLVRRCLESVDPTSRVVVVDYHS